MMAKYIERNRAEPQKEVVVRCGLPGLGKIINLSFSLWMSSLDLDFDKDSAKVPRILLPLKPCRILTIDHSCQLISWAT